MKKETSLLLASQSPRRRELLSFIGLKFDVASADVDERILPDEKPADYVLRLSVAKARAIPQPSPSALSQKERGLVVIGSDTAVVDAGEILGKPRDKSDAELMLRQLRGNTHQVYTAITLFDKTSQEKYKELCISDVPMRNYSDAEMKSYIETGDPLDKAGGYGIQNDEFQPVEKFVGCFASVMGLPLCHLARSLKKAGLEVKTDIPQACKTFLDYECTVSDAILRGENFG